MKRLVRVTGRWRYAIILAWLVAIMAGAEGTRSGLVGAVTFYSLASIAAATSGCSR